MKKILLSMLAACLLFGSAGVGRAQAEVKPLLTVSFSGYDKLFTNINLVGQLSGNPDLGGGLEMMLKMMTLGKGLAGLDTKQPWGAAVLIDEQKQVIVYGFIPVTDLKQLIDVAKSNPQLDDLIKLNDDVYEIQASGASVYVKQKGNWAVVSEKSENLANAPADPLQLFGDLSKRYDLAVRLTASNAPKEFRDQAAALLQAAPEGGLPQMPTESDEDYELRLNATRYAVQGLTALANELDYVLLGWRLDPDTKTTHLDLEMTAQPGTKLADQFAAMKSGKTNFAGMLAPSAAATLNWTRTLADADVAQVKNALALARKSLLTDLQSKGLSESQVKLASDVLGNVIDVATKTVETKKTDGGLALFLDTEVATLVAGASISDGATLDKALKQLVDKMQQEDAEVAKLIKLNAESYQGVRFHTMAIPTPSQKLAPLVGDKLEVVVGVGDDRVMLAAGRDAVATLKKVMDQSKAAAGKEVLPLQVSLAATPIAKVVAQTADEDEVAATADRLAKALKKADGKDHVLVTSQPIPQGFRLRVEVEAGLLKGLVSLGSAMGSAATMPPPRK